MKIPLSNGLCAAVGLALVQALAGHLSAQAITAEFPFESQYVEVFGSRIHYVEVGQGDPILFVHGNPDSIYVWRNVLPYASQVGRAIAVDLIGMGKSEVPDIEYRFFDHVKYLDEFIAKLGLKNLTLVVQDWGGQLGFYYARRNESNVKALVFMETGLVPVQSWEEFPEPARDAFRRFRTPEIGWDLIVNRNVMGDGPRTVRELSEEEKRLHVEPLQNASRRKPVWRFINEIPIGGEPADVDRVLRETHSWLQRTPLPKLLFYNVPGLIVTSERVTWCRKNLKHLSTVEVGPGFHYPQEENPHLMGREFIKWYRRIGAP